MKARQTLTKEGGSCAGWTWRRRKNESDEFLETEGTMKAGAAAVRRISLPDQTTALLRKEIFTGAYKPGEKLPSERELAERFGISRLTLRKALALLAQEGWIEITQGRNIVVNDFRTSVGIEVLPDLFFACPEALSNAQVMETIVENTARLGEQALMAAAKNAKPSDEARLLEILSGQTEELDIEEFYENEFMMIHELLRIGKNLILQMAYNSQVRLSRRLIALGLVKDRPYPMKQYHEINCSLIKAVCSGDEKQVKKLSRKYSRGLEEVFKRSLTKVKAR
jgi:GntR family L-lactate dehydrogenase operon transcriptional regulator